MLIPERPHGSVAMGIDSVAGLVWLDGEPTRDISVRPHRKESIDLPPILRPLDNAMRETRQRGAQLATICRTPRTKAPEKRIPVLRASAAWEISCR
jgi:hypothetical protein